MERGFWAGRTSFGRRKPVWKRKRFYRRMGYSRSITPYSRMGYASRFGDRRMGNFTTTRLVTEFFVTNTVAVGVPGIQGGPTLPALILGTTAASTGPGYNIPFAMQFALSQVQNATEISAVFDQYRINWVKVFITFQHNVSTASGSSTMPTLFWVPDFDDAVAVGAGALREHAALDLREFTADNRTHVMKIEPRFHGGIYDASAGAGTWGSIERGWVDVAAQNTAHYGIKGYLANVELPATGVGPYTTSFRIDVQINLSFRGFR